MSLFSKLNADWSCAQLKLVLLPYLWFVVTRQPIISASALCHLSVAMCFWVGNILCPPKPKVICDSELLSYWWYWLEAMYKNTLNPAWTNSSTCLPPDHSPSRYLHFFIWPSRISSLLQWPSEDKWVFSLIDRLQSVSHFNTPSQTVLLKSSRHHLSKSRSLFSALPQSSFWWQRTWLTSSPNLASIWSPAAGSSISAPLLMSPHPSLSRLSLLVSILIMVWQWHQNFLESLLQQCGTSSMATNLLRTSSLIWFHQT